MKHAANQHLTHRQRLERLTQLCEELQTAVEQAGDHRRLLEDVKLTAEGLLSRRAPQTRRTKTRQTG